MNTNGQLQNLQDTLQERATQEQEVIKKVYEKNLQRLSKDLQKSSARELYIMKNATLAEIRKTSRRLTREAHLMNRTFLKSWVRNLFIGAALSIAMCVALYFTVDWITSKINEETQENRYWSNTYQTMRDNLETVLEKTNGVYVVENERGKFMVFQRDTDFKQWVINSRPAIKIE